MPPCSVKNNHVHKNCQLGYGSLPAAALSVFRGFGGHQPKEADSLCNTKNGWEHLKLELVEDLSGDSTQVTFLALVVKNLIQSFSLVWLYFCHFLIFWVPTFMVPSGVDWLLIHLCVFFSLPPSWHLFVFTGWHHLTVLPSQRANDPQSFSVFFIANCIFSILFGWHFTFKNIQVIQAELSFLKPCSTFCTRLARTKAICRTSQTTFSSQDECGRTIKTC